MENTDISRKTHWEQIYKNKSPSDVSWYLTYPGQSLKLIETMGIDKNQSIIDVGGGASVLVEPIGRP